MTPRRARSFRWLASPSSNDDATEFTFKIKKAKFHNGDDVTSKSFKLGWERLVNTKSAVATEYGPSEVSYHLSMVEGYDDLLAGNATELSGVTCPDDETLVVKLASAYADFPFVASHPALAPVPECAESDVKSFYLAPVGNGPFMMDGKWRMARRSTSRSSTITMATRPRSMASTSRSSRTWRPLQGVPGR